MASVRAKPERLNQTEDKVFTIPLADALPQLVTGRHIQPGDTWYFSVDGPNLRITRARHTSTPTPDEAD